MPSQAIKRNLSEEYEMPMKTFMIEPQNKTSIHQEVAMTSTDVKAAASGAITISSNIHRYCCDETEMSDQELLEMALMMEKYQKK